MRFIQDKTTYIQQLEALRKRIGDKHIIRARPYYELLIQSSKVCFCLSYMVILHVVILSVFYYIFCDYNTSCSNMFRYKLGILENIELGQCLEYNVR